MHRISRICISALTTAGLYLMSAGTAMQGENPGRMKNVICLTPQPSARAVFADFAPQPSPTTMAAFVLPERDFFFLLLLQLSHAAGADVLAPEGRDIFGITAEHAGGLILP